MSDLQNTDRVYILRVSVLEILRETVRDLLSDRVSITDIADSSDSISILCTESEFSSLEEFKSVLICFSADG